MNRELPSEPLPGGGNRLRYLPLVLVFIAGTGLSLAVFAAWRCREWRQIRTDFNVVVRARAAAVGAAVEENDHILHTVRCLYAAMAEVNRADFQQFVEPLLSRARGIQSLAWVPRVPAARAPLARPKRGAGVWPPFNFWSKKKRERWCGPDFVPSTSPYCSSSLTKPIKP